MSRADRIVARRSEAPRVVRKSQTPRAVKTRYPDGTSKVDYVRVPHHVAGGRWWKRHAAELAERNRRPSRQKKVA